MYDLVQDEKSTKQNTAILAFLKDYKAICDKHKCCIVADATSVIAVYGEKEDMLQYWDVHLTTAFHRHKIAERIRKMFGMTKAEFKRKMKYEAIPE